MNRNYSGLFALFAHDKPDKTGTMLQRIGEVSFSVCFISLLLLALINKEKSSVYNLVALLAGSGFFLGLFMFIATGIHYSGRATGKTSFLAAAADMLKKTFLYLLLPVFVVTILIVLWAIITKQPGVQ